MHTTETEDGRDLDVEKLSIEKSKLLEIMFTLRVAERMTL